MKKFLSGALLAVMLLGFSAFTEASQAEQENLCGRYSCVTNCDEQSGDYCGPYGCGQGSCYNVRR